MTSLEDPKRRIQNLKLILDIILEMGRSREVEDRLKMIVAKVAEIFRCSNCAFFALRLEGDKQFLVLEVAFGSSEQARNMPNPRFKPGEGVVGWVYENQQSVIIANTHQDPRLSPTSRYNSKPHSLLAVPVVVGDDTVGVIIAEQDVTDWFSGTDLQLAEVMARLVGNTIEQSTIS